MQRFKNILLVLNPEIEEKTALNKAVSLARQNDARLTLFSVVYEDPDMRRFPESVGETLLTAVVSDRRQWLQDFMPTLQEHGVDGEAVVVTGIHFPGDHPRGIARTSTIW